MSPLSVADVLPLEDAFDLVIFDEASQIPLENAVPAIHRASQVIVVGDRQQLPPTNFFAASLEDDSEEADKVMRHKTIREIASGPAGPVSTNTSASSRPSAIRCFNSIRGTGAYCGRRSVATFAAVAALDQT